MKRKRISRVTKHLQTHYLGPPFSDIPKDIVQNILFRLSFKNIFVCKFVCKTWHDVVSDPEFAKLHFDENCDQPYPLVYSSNWRSLSKRLYLVQPDKDDFELKLNMCDHIYLTRPCVCKNWVTFDSRFELPLQFLDDKDSCIIGAEGNGYRIVNSSNGMLCLSHRTDSRPVIICNPITKEFIDLPDGTKSDDSRTSIIYGFGFSHVTKQYKVVRIIGHDTIRSDKLTVEVHIVGTKSWRDIDCKIRYFIFECPTYLNGFLYWQSGTTPLSLVSFDIENECFGKVLGPIWDYCYSYGRKLSVGVLGGELCVSAIRVLRTFDFWVMKDYGVKKMLSKVFSIDMHSYGRLFHDVRTPLQPLKYLDDGSLLMFYSDIEALVHVDRENYKLKFLNIRRKETNVEALVAHIPSLVSLKHSFSGLDVKVHHLRSRFRELK